MEIFDLLGVERTDDDDDNSNSDLTKGTCM